jgi:hypothetical protein
VIPLRALLEVLLVVHLLLVVTLTTLVCKEGCHGMFYEKMKQFF